ncbi:hypothetical protein [Alkalicoccobacillus murimartini]|uniref:DUF4199 domain-containing protein n=1 Tax=Alkalicoccobacillus murimartini TaxID=171685 RepID=A0ABT9YBP7_9BACI|nr:hypothetical protein [Alkalicoccobacillus murimartini]MDQ0205264.1 hypothetical protein [Alkalicoccobacillus murimartini]
MIKIVLTVLLILSAMGFGFCHMLANDTPPYSSMGNIAILFMIALIPLFIGVVYCWYVLIQPTTRKWRKWLIFILPVHIFVAIIYQYRSLDDYRELLVENYNTYDQTTDQASTEEYIEMITQGLNSQMNSQYFNLNTWLAFVSLTIWVAFIFRLLIQKKKNRVCK